MLGLDQLHISDQADPYSYYGLAGKLVPQNDWPQLTLVKQGFMAGPIRHT